MCIRDRPDINPSEGHVVNYLKKNQKQNKSYAYDSPGEDRKEAELIYKKVGEGDHYSFVEVMPKSGRHHQIRVQLSAINSIIKGDLKYGAKRSNKDASICLHAREINFVHPVKKEVVKICAPPPKNPIWKACL